LQSAAYDSVLLTRAKGITRAFTPFAQLTGLIGALPADAAIWDARPGLLMQPAAVAWVTFLDLEM
jgi:hypothetical protein